MKTFLRWWWRWWIGPAPEPIAPVMHRCGLCLRLTDQPHVLAGHESVYHRECAAAILDVRALSRHQGERP